MKSWMSLAAAGMIIAPSVALATTEARQTETGLDERWMIESVVVVLDPSLEDLGPGASDAIKAAMQTWHSAASGVPTVTFEDGTSRVGAAHDGKNVLSAAPLGVPLALTTTYASDQTGAIVEADIVFNTSYAFASMPTVPASCSGVFDIGAVATHEAGHFFGLGEDYADATSTMYVTTAPCDPHKRVLGAGDIEAISALYAPPTTLSAKCDASPAPRSFGVASIVAIGLGLLGVARRMRSSR
jgi:hypothetical protein